LSKASLFYYDHYQAKAGFSFARQFYDEVGPFAWPAFHPDSAAMPFYNGLGDEQPKPGAPNGRLAGSLQPLELLKQLGLVFLADPGTAVPNLDTHAIPSIHR
jgi:hypothetical protein